MKRKNNCTGFNPVACVKKSPAKAERLIISGNI